MKLLFIAADGLGFKSAQVLGERINLRSGLLKSLPDNMNFSGPAWTSIYTGVPPEKHGVISTWGHHVEDATTIHGKYIEKSEGYDTLKYPCIWDYLNSEGLTCGLYGIPITYPVRRVNKWAVAGFCRSLKSSDDCLYYNLKVETEMDVAESFVRIAGASNSKEWAKIKVEGFNRILDICEENYQKRFALLEGILDGFPVDCLFLSFEFFDRIGHLYSNTESKESLDFAEEWLRYLVEAFKAEKIICVSDHGFTEGGHDYNGGVIGNIELPTSVLDVKNCILKEFNISLHRDVEIAPLNSEVVEDREDERVKEILQSLGYI